MKLILLSCDVCHEVTYQYILHVVLCTLPETLQDGTSYLSTPLSITCMSGCTLHQQQFFDGVADADV